MRIHSITYFCDPATPLGENRRQGQRAFEHVRKLAAQIISIPVPGRAE
jgi:hypothetical protein